MNGQPISKHQASEIIAQVMARGMGNQKIGNWQVWHAFMPAAIIAVDELQKAGVVFDASLQLDDQQAAEFEREIMASSPVVARVNQQLKMIWGCPLDIGGKPYGMTYVIRQPNGFEEMSGEEFARAMRKAGRKTALLESRIKRLFHRMKKQKLPHDYPESGTNNGKER